MKKPLSIAVIGCGTAGLSAALGLARGGHHVTLVERFSDCHPVGAGVLLQPLGLWGLHQMGLLDEIAPFGSRIESLHGTETNNRAIMTIIYKDLRPGLYGLGMHRGHLIENMLKAVQSEAVTCLFGHEVLSIRPEYGRYALVTVRSPTHSGAAQSLTSDQTDLSEKTRFDGVVIANGAESTLIDSSLFGRTSSRYPWGAFWSIVPASNLNASSLLQRYRGSSRMIGLLPSGLDPNTQAHCESFFYSVKVSDHDRNPKLQAQHCLRDAVSLWPAIAPALANLEHGDLTFARYGDTMLSRYHHEGIVCIGDAAHATSPQLGLGANLGIIDGLVLAECVRQGRTWSGALSNYTRRRQPHIRFYQQASRWLTPLFQSGSRTGGVLRNISLPLSTRIRPTYHQALQTVVGIKTRWLPGGNLMTLDELCAYCKNDTGS